ncbi:MAG: aminomethyl-transferring glycine dehydrogenase subunit GcvPB [Bdellovibrio sp.]|nr:aminomethyl-transferring glycine dehydrogenase subunit GcvPB [Bdellovibrio sp.]
MATQDKLQQDTLQMDKLPYNPKCLERELRPYYIGARDQEIDQMLKEVGFKYLDDLFAHIPQEVKFKGPVGLGQALSYEELLNHVTQVGKKNRMPLSFIGDGLPHYKIPDLVSFVCNIRGLTTAYTPYQPERSQGTLHSLWAYTNMMSQLTGFEAINASLYDRATALFEGLLSATRITGHNTVIVSEGVYPEDREVVETMAHGTKLRVIWIPLHIETGVTDLAKLKQTISAMHADLAAIAFPQVNCLGLLENVDEITDLAHENKLLALTVVDPMLLATGGLRPPADFGLMKDQSGQKIGADLLVGEAQHLALAPNFGGPGLGLFGCRYASNNKNAIRSTPGRFVGKGHDSQGNPAYAMVLSTREQHIRREKATSNICSNESFIATLAGAAVLARGEQGMSKAILEGRKMALRAVEELTALKGLSLAFPQSAFFNEFVLSVDGPSLTQLLKNAQKEDLQPGLDVTTRITTVGSKQLLMLSFTDRHCLADVARLTAFFARHLRDRKTPSQIAFELPKKYARATAANLPSFSQDVLKDFYQKLGELNVSPDDNIYPLGSCTMKYNPYINDYLAGLPEFTHAHPKAPIEDIQGCLQILFETQEQFKKITGLAGVTTQPVAGAQGELVGLKMIQAYHRERKDNRDIILIPKSAHGTNPASASVAGFENIITLTADSHGQIDLPFLDDVLSKHGPHVAGIMVTNPNTSGIFESNFHRVAAKIHDVGGLVYMDGANMNAIAGIIDLAKLGVDAVHNNLHKTWSISHGGGGPGDAIVAVSEKLLPYLPGHQVILKNGAYTLSKAPKSIGSIHRHFGNFAHKIRSYSYIKALGDQGVKKMSEVAVLSSVYLLHNLKKSFPILPANTETVPRMHEFILTLSAEDFALLEKNGTARAQAMARVGKLFLDFGLHAPTVAFPEVFGLMIEPTESFSKSELERFTQVVLAIARIIREYPAVLTTVPHFTPVYKVDEVEANKNIVLREDNFTLPEAGADKLSPKAMRNLKVDEIVQKIVQAHELRVKTMS